MRRSRRGGARTRRKLPQAPPLAQGNVVTIMGVMQSGGKDGKSDGKTAQNKPARTSPARGDRLAAAMRENLRRRKAQARGRATAESGENEPDPRKDDAD